MEVWLMDVVSLLSQIVERLTRPGRLFNLLKRMARVSIRIIDGACLRQSECPVFELPRRERLIPLSVFVSNLLSFALALSPPRLRLFALPCLTPTMVSVEGSPRDWWLCSQYRTRAPPFSDHHNGLRTSKDNTNMADVTVWYNIWCSSRCCWSADQVWIPLDQTHVDSFQFGAGVPTCSLNVLTLPTYSTTSKLSSNGLPSKAVSIKKDYDAVAVSVKFTQCSDALLVL